MPNTHSLGQKLSFLLFQKGMRVMDLAREIEVPQPTLHRIITGKSKKPHHDTLTKIAHFFNLDSSELTDDTTHWHANKDNQKNTHAIPLLTIQDDYSFDEMLRDAEKTLVVTHDISEHAFGIVLSDESLLPLFHLGSILIFDSLKTPHAGSYVFVLLGSTHKYTVRQLLTDGEHSFLKPLNPDIAQLGVKVLADHDQIIGTLVEARQSYA